MPLGFKSPPAGLPNRRMKERKKKMSKTTTHRDPIRRAARIEKRAKKRVETAMRKNLVKMMRNRVKGR